MTEKRVSRRWFIGRAAAIAPAATLGATTVAAKASEYPRLVQLGRDLDEAITTVALASEQNRQVRARYDALCPVVPEDLVVPPGCPWACGELERDVEGNDIYGEDQCQRRITTSAELELDVQDYSARSKAGRAARRQLKIAKEYEAAVQAARNATNIGAAIEAVYWASFDLERVGRKISEAPARSLEGIAIKARAIAVMESVDARWRGWSTVFAGPALARSVLEVVETPVVEA